MKDPQKKKRSDDRKRPRLIFVDDYMPILENARRYLAEDFAIEVHQDPSEALESIRKTNPDIIITDINMGDIDGYDLCQKVKSLPSCEHVPIVFFSSNDDDHTKDRVRDVGGHSLVSKSVSLCELKTIAISACIQRD